MFHSNVIYFTGVIFFALFSHGVVNVPFSTINFSMFLIKKSFFLFVFYSYWCMRLHIYSNRILFYIKTIAWRNLNVIHQLNAALLRQCLKMRFFFERGFLSYFNEDSKETIKQKLWKEFKWKKSFFVIVNSVNYEFLCMFSGRIAVNGGN